MECKWVYAVALSHDGRQAYAGAPFRNEHEIGAAKAKAQASLKSFMGELYQPETLEFVDLCPDL